MITWQYRYEIDSTEGKRPQSIIKVQIRLWEESRGDRNSFRKRLSDLPEALCNQGYFYQGFTKGKIFYKSRKDTAYGEVPIFVHITEPFLANLRLARDITFRTEGLSRPDEFIDFEKLRRNLDGKR